MNRPSRNSLVLWSGSFEWITRRSNTKKYSRWCSLTVPWNKAGNFREFNPGGDWSRHVALHLLDHEMSRCTSVKSALDLARKRGRDVVFVLEDGRDPLVEELKISPAFLLFSDGIPRSMLFDVPQRQKLIKRFSV